MSKRLVPYAGAEQPRPRRMSDASYHAAFLAKIIERQKRGKLLSEIGVEFGSLPVVRATVLVWLFEVPA